MRVVGIDLGERRIGIAASDATGTLASPRCTVTRGADPDVDRKSLADLAIDLGAHMVVVGLPIGLDGSEGRAARAARAEAKALEALLSPAGIGVEMFDERFTTIRADQALAAAGRSGKSRRKVIDQSAAAVLLQAWLDSHPSSKLPAVSPGDPLPASLSVEFPNKTEHESR